MRKQQNKPKKFRPAKREQWGNPGRRDPVHPSEHPAAEITELTRVVHPITGAYMTGLAFKAEVDEANEVYGQWPVPESSILSKKISTVGAKVGANIIQLVQALEPSTHIPAEQFENRLVAPG